MGFSRGPKLPTDTLNLALDAGNTKSYPGSGNTWTDLSGNGFNGSLNNSPGFNSDNVGSIVFDGINDYIFNTSFNYDDSSGTFTVLAWIYPTTVVTANAYEAIMNKSDSGNHVFSTYIHTSDNSMRAWHFDSGGSINNYESSLIISFNTWNMLAYVFDQSVGYTFYLKNSTTDSSETDSGAITARTDSTNQYMIGRWRNGGYHYSGRMANVYHYTSALTSAQIQEYYNATKGRFGL